MQTFLELHHVPAFPTNLDSKRECDEALRTSAWEASQIQDLKTHCKDPLCANVSYFCLFSSIHTEKEASNGS